MSKFIIFTFFVFSLPAIAQERMVEFSWEKNPQAVKYEAQIFKSKKIIETIQTDSTFWQGKLSPGKYFVKIRSFDKRAVPGPWSEAMELEVLYSKIKNLKSKQNQENLEFTWDKGVFEEFEVSIFMDEKILKKEKIKSNVYKTNIQDGKYTFKVKGAADVFSEENTLSVEVLVPKVERKPSQVINTPKSKPKLWKVKIDFSYGNFDYLGENRFNNFNLPVQTVINYKGIKTGLDVTKSFHTWQWSNQLELWGQSISEQQVISKNFNSKVIYPLKLKSFTFSPSIGLGYKEIFEFIPTYQSQGQINSLTTLNPILDFTLNYEGEKLKPFVKLGFSPVLKTLSSKQGEVDGQDTKIGVGVEYKPSSWGYKIEYVNENIKRSYKDKEGFLEQRSSQISLGVKYEF